MLSFITSLFSGSYTPGSTMSVFGTDNSIAYNPASGLPMVSGESSGVDVAGNLFGSSASNHDSVNPATGLPMVTGDSFGVDLGGNTFGTNDFSSGISNNSFGNDFGNPFGE